MKSYLAETVNPNYKGMVARIQFVQGKATLDEAAAAETERDLPEIVRIFEELGIILTEVHKCPKCDKTCQSKFALTGHMKTHAGEEPVEVEALTEAQEPTVAEPEGDEGKPEEPVEEEIEEG